MALSYSLKPFIPFFICSLIHFYYCYTIELLQKGISKALLMPSLIFAYYFSSNKMNVKVIIILFLHWWGDIFFIGENTYFYAVFCFWLGDIINFLEFYKNLNKFNLAYFITALFLVSPPVIYYANFMLAKHVEHIMIYVFYGYIIPLSLMVIFSIMHFLEKKNLTNLLFMIGNMLFIFSDMSVIWVSYTERYDFDSLIIMTTYVLAETWIINWYLVKENSAVVEKVRKYA